MPFLTRKLIEAAVILAASAGLAFIMIATANSLVAKSTIWKSYAAWLSVVTRSDIVATTLLAMVVTMVVTAYRISLPKR